MKHARIKDSSSVKLDLGSITRQAFLVILFITGLMFAVASLPPELTNPYETAVGPYSSQINQKLVEIHEAEQFLVWLHKNDASDIELVVQEGKIRRLKIELAELRAMARQAMNEQSGACFTADMRVLTKGGSTPISEVKIGDRILTSNKEGLQVLAEVLKTHTATNYHYFLINEKIKATALHPFFTETGWKKARELKVGDKIKVQSGGFEEILSVEWYAKNLDVYNLTVSKNHNFFISADGKKGYLVHNTAGAGGGAGVGAGAGAGGEINIKFAE